MPLSIGILGGSFNPPHKGHIHISEVARRKLRLDQIWWVVSKQNPLEKKEYIFDYDKRISKCRDITANCKNIKISRAEKNLFPYDSKVYTYKLLKRLWQMYPKTKFYFIIGSDNLENFHKWQNSDEIFNIAELIVISRSGHKYKALSSKTARKFRDKIHFIHAKHVNISSTEIRNDGK